MPFKFTGFEDWIPIFTGGIQIDSAGIKHDGDDLIKRAINTFDAKYHEPPLVLGHPEHDKPAYGWVESLKVGQECTQDKPPVNVLYAKFKDVQSDFTKLIQDGLYKKRSASFYPDGRLRHVGFLGAASPAVKGLANVKFNEVDEAKGSSCFNFSDEDADKLFTFTNMFSEMFHKFFSNKPEDSTLTTHKKEPTIMPFSEQDAQDLLAKEREKMDKHFTDIFAKKSTEFAEKLRADFAAERRLTQVMERKTRIDGVCQKMLAAGRIIPAQIDGGLKHFMEVLTDCKPLEFAEKIVDGKNVKGKTIDAFDYFLNFLDPATTAVKFGEHPTISALTLDDDPGLKIDGLIAEIQKVRPEVPYNMAFTEVQTEHPELAAQYEFQLAQGRAKR